MDSPWASPNSGVQRFILLAKYGKSVEERAQKCNVAVTLLLNIDGDTTQVCRGSNYRPADDASGILPCGMHCHNPITKTARNSSLSIRQCKAIGTSCNTAGLRLWDDQFSLRWFDIHGDAKGTIMLKRELCGLLLRSRSLPISSLMDGQ